jgi:NitT/TauT family transport system substrate-binding protein
MRKPTRIGIVLGTTAILAAGSIGSATAQDELTPIDLQLQWFAQAQFGGFYAAKDLGYYADQGLDVTISETPSDQAPQVLGSQPDGPEFTIAWVPRVLEVRESEEDPSDLVNIAQHFQRSGTLSVSWADNPVPTPADFAGKKVGVWDFGNDFEVIAAGRLEGLEPNVDYERIIQAFDMNAFLNREIDVAEAMIYNEYAQVLETENPETGELYQPEDMVVIDYNEVGTAMLQDAIWARESWLAEEGNEDIATRFLAASFKGWQYCRDNPDECSEIAANNGSILGVGHQAWMMNEINALIWPSPDGIGALPVDSWNETVENMIATDLIQEVPPEGAYRTDLADAARAMIDGDVTGDDFVKADVQPTPGGE